MASLSNFLAFFAIAATAPATYLHSTLHLLNEDGRGSMHQAKLTRLSATDQSGEGRRAAWPGRALLLAAIVTVFAISCGPADAHPARFALQPITIQRINLPKSVTDARWPGFAADNQHLLFFSSNELWITSLHGTGVHCLSCGVTNDPKISDSADFASPFPDGKRVLIEEDVQPGSSKLAVLKCQPSVDHCARKQILPVDVSAAEPATIPPGGAVSSPQQTLFPGSYHAKLSPDGRYVAFSVLRSDAFETMVVGKLERSGSEYVVSDPRVINPPAPSSPSDPKVADWSDSSALTEFKAFTNGGADATYVEVGGPSIMSTQVWSVNLATGRRTRLTDNPDWNEDNGMSPDGQFLSLYSERTLHFIDWEGGLVPVRDFIDAPAAAMSAGAVGGLAGCEGPMWLLPPTGDNGGTLAGQPIVDYKYSVPRTVDNLAGASQWSPNGTMIALASSADGTARVAPRYILIAHLTRLKPTRPLPPVSSQPGSWAPSPTDYHGTMGHQGSVTLRGPGGGTVTVSYDPLDGALAGSWAETYANYSDDGRDFVNGTVTISGTALDGTYSEHLVMTGANTGNDDTDLTFSTSVSGHASSTYDGHTITGPPSYAVRDAQGGPSSACPSVHAPRLRIRTRKFRRGVYRVTVTASVAGVGPAETLVDTQPVDGATLTYGRRATQTNADGVATVHLLRSEWLHVSAGDTLVPSSARLILSSARRRR
jgi:hypothetical protein